MQRQLDIFEVHFKISSAIKIRAPAHEELPPSAKENENEIAFLVITFECEVRFLFVSFVRQFLGELPLHLL